MDTLLGPLIRTSIRAMDGVMQGFVHLQHGVRSIREV